MNINQYYLYKYSEFKHELPILDTVKMEQVPAGGLGAALQKRVEDNKKKLEMDRRAKLKTPLINSYINRGLHLWN